MKLFIVAALLVAAVSGFQPVHQYGFRPVGGNDLVLKRLLGHPLERSYIYGEKVDVPTYLRDEIVDQPIYQIDEIVAHPLFRVYYNLPYFHQYFHYPAFQRYVASIYFQRFWQIPAFQQYFVNPELFYKYVFPLVTYFQHGETYNHHTVQDWPWNKNVESSVYYSREHAYPQSIFDQIYKHLNVNSGRHGRLQEIHTEVQLTPEGVVREETVGKIVNPVTGHVRYTVGDAKVVGEHIVPVESVYPEREYYGREQYHHEQYQHGPFYPRYFQHSYNYPQWVPHQRFPYQPHF